MLGTKLTDHTDMEVFARVVATKSMTAAGREIGLSPAVISKRLKRLETKLGSRLLQRTTRQISLTEAGQGYYERIVPILAKIEDAENFVSRRSNYVSGKLKITAPTFFGKRHIAPHLSSLLERHPDMSIKLELCDDIVDIVADGYDIAIKIGQLLDSSLVTRKLAQVKQFLCASPEYIAKFGRPTSIADLAFHNCISIDQEPAIRLHGRDGPHTIAVSTRLQTNSNEVVRAATISGAGIALQSTWESGQDLRDGRLQIVLPEYRGADESSIHALFPSRNFLPAKVRTFIDYFAALYGSSPYWEDGI